MAEVIEQGYLNHWAETRHVQNDNALQRYSTNTRWEQYQSGVISRADAVAYAIKRAHKAIDKDTAKKLEHLERVATAPDLQYLSICVEWNRSVMWGYNPTAYITSNNGNTYGHASGCGYDKRSAAVAEALNANDSVLKALYTYKEKRLQAGGSDFSETSCSGHDNRDIIGYGAGCASIPYFEGGVGVSCFWDIFRKMGFAVEANESGKHSDFYSIFTK